VVIAATVIAVPAPVNGFHVVFTCKVQFFLFFLLLKKPLVITASGDYITPPIEELANDI
jgi:hypothetical protein